MNQKSGHIGQVFNRMSLRHDDGEEEEEEDTLHQNEDSHDYYYHDESEDSDDDGYDGSDAQWFNNRSHANTGDWGQQYHHDRDHRDNSSQGSSSQVSSGSRQKRDSDEKRRTDSSSSSTVSQRVQFWNEKGSSREHAMTLRQDTPYNGQGGHHRRFNSQHGEHKISSRVQKQTRTLPEQNWTRGLYDATENGGKLRPQDAEEFRSAGILPLKFTTRGVEVLLSLSREERRRNLCLSVLGGKANGGEKPIETAVRNFRNAVNGTVSKEEIKRLIKLDGDRRTSARMIWIGSERFVLWAADGTSINEQLHSKSRSRGCAVWLNWTEIQISASENGRMSVKMNKDDQEDDVHLNEFLVQLARDTDFASIMSRIMSDMLERDMKRELGRVNKQLSAPRDEQLSQLIGKRESLALKTPPLPPPSPIRTLNPSDAGHQQAIGMLPADAKSRVVSVRQVNVSARKSTYDAEKAKQANNVLAELRPVFHGTPERWRATAIAIHGFDTSIRLNGRALGDGIYSANTPDTPLGYTNNTGSLLYMQGMVTKEDHGQESAGNAAPGTVFVFRQAERVLPLYIVDFAPSTADKPEHENQIRENLKQLEIEAKKMREEMRVREKQFHEDILKRWNSAGRFYESRLKEFLARLKETTDVNVINQLRRRFEIEKCQFASRLPVFAEKESILQNLRDHDVIILMAATGSGKSTQIPQYLLDDVFGHKERRRIAVLQPRRVNAISLGRRVSSERFVEMGDEVGYRVGLGDKCTSDDTRIEFMTHGLFVQMAQNPQYLMNQYCAVILDEAHERSIEVDLSFALLRRVLSVRQADTTFKVIVMSATIEGQAREYQEFLQPGKQKSKIMSIAGQTFPVYVQHRSDVEPDKEVVGSGGVGKIISSSALQVALDLIHSNNDGNVLIFLPGESHIRTALRLAFLTLSKSSSSAQPSTSTGEDSFGDGSNGFTIRITQQSQQENTRGRRKPLTIGVWPFYGKLTSAQRDRVLNPPQAIDRMIVFSTNVAETGLTIPNVRYVVDTGLERRVQYNRECSISEMVTEPITRASMEQRAGRAGRIASGICVRLYSKETEESLKHTESPDIQTKQLHSTVLRLHAIEKRRPGQQLQLLTPIPEEAYQDAEKTLRLFGALGDDNNITKEGHVLLRLGIDLQLGRFLIACNTIGCLARGAKLASMLVSNTEDRLLHRDLKHERFISQTGDHLTLLTIFEAFEETRSKLTWCSSHGFDYELLSEASRVCDHLFDILVKLGYSLESSKTLQEHGGPDRAILRALCAGYFAQLAVARSPGGPKDGFVWLVDEERRKQLIDATARFSLANAPLPVDDSGDGSANTTDNNDGNPSVLNSNNGNEQLLRLDARSTLWKNHSKRDGNESLAVFGSAMLTDGVRSGKGPAMPTVHTMSWVTPEDVEAGAQNWCRHVEFNNLLGQMKRQVSQFNIPSKDEAKRLFLKDKGSWLENIRRRHPRVAISLSDKKDKVIVSAPGAIMPLIQSLVQRRLDLARETIELQIPASVNIMKFIGREGSNTKQLTADLQELVQDYLGTTDIDFNSSDSVDYMRLGVKPEDQAVFLTLGGHAKSLMGVLVGRIQSALCDMFHLDVDDLQVSMPAGAIGQKIQNNPRLMKLSTNRQPTALNTRDDAMLLLAHAAIWQAGCSVYGGFVRDWVIRGKRANDIDVLTPINGVQQVAGIMKNAAQAMNINLITEKAKGAAHTLVFSWAGESIDVDLVDPSQVNVIPPGVDCDAGNLMINSQGVLCKKVPAAGGAILSVHQSVEHVENKKFVFFYNVSNCAESLRRLTKYLERGWICLSKQPNMPELQKYSNFLQPEQQYSRDWTV